MAHLIPTAKQPRRGTLYSREEIAIISRYKVEYKDQTTRPLRAHTMRTKILVDIFNYWDKQGMLLSEEVVLQRAKEVAAWVRNNWRPNVNVTQSNPNIRMRMIDLVWETRRDAVEEELKILLGIDELDQRDQRYFQQRNAAAKLALEKMSVHEKAQLQSDLEARRMQGNPEPVQRYRAEKHRGRVLQTFSKERWLDMGMSTITFTAHIDEQGRLIGDLHEDVLHNMGISGHNFAEQHPEIVTEMTRKFMDYVKSARLEAADSEIADRRQAESEPIEIRMTTEGFPIIPKLVTEKELKKAVWERLLRAFLTQHYYLCSGQKSRQVPYSAIKADTASFIPNEYLPSGIVIQDPRNMHLDDIRNVLQHCYRLQVGSGPESSFRFGSFIGPKRKTLFANYPDAGANKRSEPGIGRKKKGKGKQREDVLQGLLQIDESMEVPTTDHIRNQDILPGVAGPSANRIPDVNGLVRIDMRQMVELKEMGYEAMGPVVNGPNEGYPEYEVSTSVFKMLKSQHAPTPNQIAAPVPLDGFDPERIRIDPSLFSQDSAKTGQQIEDAHTMSQDGFQRAIPTTGNSIMNPIITNLSPNRLPTDGSITSITNPPITNISPTRPPIDKGGSAKRAPNKTGKKKVGKKAQADLPRETMVQTRSTNKKKVTDDDLAALEAQNMLQSGSKRRTKPTRRG